MLTHSSKNQGPLSVHIPASHTIWNACWLSMALLASAFLLGLLVPAQSAALSAKKQCIKERCKQPKRECIQAFATQYKTAKAACVNVGSKKTVRTCKKTHKRAFKKNKRACNAAYKKRCKICCAGDVTTACDVQVCGDGIQEVGEECDNGDASACPGACRADCTCGLPPCLDCDKDTDGDGLNDWEELNTYHTSPLMKDTDGDGAYDKDEILIGGGAKACLADMPELELRLLGNPDIVLNIDRETGSTEEHASLVTNLEGRVDTDTVSTHMAIGNTVTLKTRTEAGTQTWPPSFNAELTTEHKFEHEYIHDTSSSWTKESVQETRDSAHEWMKERTTWQDGEIHVAIGIYNKSNLFFKMKDLSLLASRIEFDGTLTPIGTIRPEDEDRPFWDEGKDIGPNNSITLLGVADKIGAAAMEKLVRHPKAMSFEVGSYSLYETDASGMKLQRSFFKVAEDVAECTGLITIDAGDGRVERYYVATNVHRNEFNEPLGVSLGEALGSIIALPYETIVAENQDAGQSTATVLYRLKGQRSYRCDDASHVDYGGPSLCPSPDSRGFWFVGGTGSEFEGATPVDFDDIVLRQGERINLVYLNDTDGDGIFDREEYLLGTDKNKPDTDGDTLTDYAESKVGWEVTVTNESPYRTYSDPRSKDTDDDGLDDNIEVGQKGTDPMLDDTDRDGRPDSSDDDPLTPYECRDGTAFSIMAWWNGSTTHQFVNDVWWKTDGILNGDVTAESLPDGDVVFDFNQAAGDAYISMNHTAAFTQMTKAPGYTVSLWILWDGSPYGVNDRTALLVKGQAVDTATFAVYIDAVGSNRILKFTQRVRFHRKRYCRGAGGDGCAADDTGDRVYTVSKDITDLLIPGKWMHIAARFDNTWHDEYMSVCANGSCQTTDPKRQGKYGCGTWDAYLCEEWAIYYSYDYPTQDLLVGKFATGGTRAGQFDGAMDDIQLFAYYLDDRLVTNIYETGRENDFICQPEN